MDLVELLTYCSTSVRKKLTNSYPEHIHELEDGSIRLKVAKIKTERTDNHAASLIRCKPSDLEWVSDVFTLCSEVAEVSKGESAWDMVTEEGETLIELAYNRKYINEDGQECLKPKCFGRFM